jgi:hypothetical protein
LFTAVNLLTHDSNFLRVKVRLVTYRSWTANAFELMGNERVVRRLLDDRHYLATGDLSLSLWILFHILLSTAPLMPGADEFGVIFEPRRNCLGAMSVSFDELDHLLNFLSFSPSLEGLLDRQFRA